MNTLEKYVLGCIVLALLLLVAWSVINRPDSVTLSSDKWECQIAVPKGIRTICTNYVVKVAK